MTNDFEREALLITNDLKALADEFAGEGRIIVAGRVLTGLQLIRTLWTRLYPPAPAAPVDDGVLVAEAPPEAPPVP